MIEVDPPITIEKLMAVTGLGRNQVYADVRAGTLPGRIRGRKLVLTAAEFRRWQNGEWTPVPHQLPVEPDAPPTSGFLKRRKESD